MKAKEETNSIIEICPIRNVVARFGDKWSLLVLLVIDGEGVVRFNEPVKW
jgi:DNA-binding HxlR family transcriptional regulator